MLTPPKSTAMPEKRVRVMAANPLVDYKTYGENKHQRVHLETIFCDGHLCTEVHGDEADAFKNGSEG